MQRNLKATGDHPKLGGMTLDGEIRRTRELTGDKVRSPDSPSILAVELVAMLDGGCFEPSGNGLSVGLVLFVGAKQPKAGRCWSGCWSHLAGGT